VESEASSCLVSSHALRVVMVVLVGNADTLVRACMMRRNVKSTRRIKVESILNQRWAIRDDFKVLCWLGNLEDLFNRAAEGL